MRWPIRNQILLPFVSVQALAIGAIAAATSWMAVRNVERGIESQLANVVAALEGASFPLTLNVLQQLRSFSGAHFILVDNEHRVIESTLRPTTEGPLEFSIPSDKLTGREVVGHADPLMIAGEPYFVGSVRWVDGRRGGRVLVLYPQADWRAARGEAMFPPLVIGTVLLIVTVTVSILLARRFGRRIHLVETQVSRIAGGDFCPMELPPIDDELRDLSRSVNRMANALADSHQRIRESERSALLTQLVGGLAHQLRNAITGARISVQLHQRRCRTSDDESLDVALKQLKLTEEQLKALLRVTRGETRSLVCGDASEILHATIALVRPICEHHQITLTTASAELPWMIEDADAMRAALLNLMMNAIEATGPSGAIRVESQATPGRLRISIADDGPGFPFDHDIFQAFFSTKREGVGLGLSLARQAVEDCGGTLIADRIDGWTRFEITLLKTPRKIGLANSKSQAEPSGQLPAEVK